MFLRPCFLVIDREFAGSISSRKLVIETAKFNVITAYSYPEALATLERFPRLHGAVVTADQRGEAATFLTAVRQRHPDVKTVLTGEMPDGEHLADRRVQSFTPAELLATLQDLFPEEAHTVEETERKLEIKATEE